MDIVVWIFFGTNLFLTFAYMVVFSRLKRVMRMIGEDFELEKRSVNYQFYTFFFVELANFTEVLFFQFRTKNPTTFIIDQIICAIVLKILPTTVFLYLHYRAFSPRIEQRTSSHTSDSGKRVIKTNNFDFITDSDIQTTTRES